MEDSKVSEFKNIGGQRTLVSKKQMGHSGSLPSLSRQGMGSSSSAFFSQNNAFRQRGILSEVVKPHRRNEVDSCNLGPADLGTCSSTLRKSASATSFHLSNRLRAKAQEAEPKTPRKIFQDVEPKVIEVYAHKPGDRPRKVTVERRRKWFEALDVVALLEERNCNFSPNWDRDFWLQLDDFNNIEFDIRTPEQWLELGQQPDGSFLPLQAKAMRFHETKGSVWEDCTVEGLKDLKDGKGTKDFMVRWASSTAEAPLEPVGRLRIVVQGEDPEVYADRILYAFEALQKAQARIRLNFFVDNMPVDDIQTLDDDQVTRVLDLSRNSAALREVPETFSSALVREANLDFARTMNKIILIADPQVQKPPGYRYQQAPGQQMVDLSSLLDEIDVDDLEDAGENPFEKDVPWFSLWPVPEYCFTDAFSSFCFASLYIRPEVVASLGEVCQENLNLMASCIYANRFTRLMKPEQFRQIERSAITTMAHKIREQWVVNIQKIILNNFRDVGKGWFSIHETNQDTYRQGKLKKLLAVVKNMMQDSLEFFTLDSVDDYCHGLEELCPEKVLVKDLNQVESQFVERPRPKAAKRGGSLQLIPPGRPGAAFYGGDRDDDSVDLLPGSALFLLEIKISEEKAFVYSTSSDAAIEMCSEILDMGMMSLGDIPQVEPQIVPQLFKTVVVKQVLNTVDVNTPRDEGAPVPFVKARKATMMVNLKKALPALDEYISLFSAYEDLVMLEPAAFVQTKADAEISTPETKACILEQLQKETEVLDSIPESVVIGLFEVSCQEIRKSLAGKHRKISELLLEMLLARFRDGAQEIVDGYQGIFAQLRKAPKDIEEVATMREYMATIPAEILKLAPDTKRCLDTYGVLEEFGVQLTADDFYQRWRVFGCPKSTFDLVAKVEEDIKELEAQFEAAQQQEQADFDESIVDMAKTIENFSQYSDFEKLDEIYENVESVNERLKSAATQAKLFNSRELLFGKEVRDYSMIAQLTKEWEPFTQLWVTAYNWTKDSKKWLTGPFQQVDAKGCESSVAAGTKTLFKAVKAFEKRESCDEVLQIAKTIKEQMDDFAPKVPLVVGLRNQGMADRHWEQCPI